MGTRAGHALGLGRCSHRLLCRGSGKRTIGKRDNRQTTTATGNEAGKSTNRENVKDCSTCPRKPKPGTAYALTPCARCTPDDRPPRRQRVLTDWQPTIDRIEAREWDRARKHTALQELPATPRQSHIIDLLRSGLTATQTARHLRIDRSTLYADLKDLAAKV